MKTRAAVAFEAGKPLEVVEVDLEGKVVWQIADGLVSNQYSAVRLENGNTLIADCGHHRVVVFDQDCNVVWKMDGFGLSPKRHFGYNEAFCFYFLVKCFVFRWVYGVYSSGNHSDGTCG